MQEVQTDRVAEEAPARVVASAADAPQASDRSAVRVGVLIPEFPGQTHAFFWRELNALRRMGMDARLVSTRKPPGSPCHEWSGRAIDETTYLLPLGVGGAFAAVGRAVCAGPAAWGAAFRSILGAECGGPRGLVNVLAAALLGARMAVFVRQEGISHVHVHSCANAALIAVFSEVFGGSRFSMTLHGPLRDYGGAQRLKWRRATFSIIITRALRREVREQLAFVPEESVEIAPMGVDKETYRRSTPYAPYAGDGELRLISCARLHPRKGHQEAIRAVSILRQRGAAVRLTVLGEGEHRASLENLVDELGLRDAVELPGATDESQVRAALESSHIFVLASHAEPLGVAIMEAMAMEMPVVTTRAGGVPELVDDGETGMLVSPQAPEELADAIEAIASDPDRAARMGVAARKRIEAKFHSGVSAEVIARRVAGPAESTKGDR